MVTRGNVITGDGILIKKMYCCSDAVGARSELIKKSVLVCEASNAFTLGKMVLMSLRVLYS